MGVLFAIWNPVQRDFSDLIKKTPLFKYKIFLKILFNFKRKENAIFLQLVYLINGNSHLQKTPVKLPWYYATSLLQGKLLNFVKISVCL